MSISLNIQTVSGKIITLTVNENDTIASIKDKLKEIEGKYCIATFLKKKQCLLL